MQQHTNPRTMSVRDISDNPTNDLQEEFAADPLLPTLMRQHNVLDYNDPPHMLGSAEDHPGSTFGRLHLERERTSPSCIRSLAQSLIRAQDTPGTTGPKETAQ